MSDALQRIQALTRELEHSPRIETRTELLILRARIEGEQVYLEALQDCELWNAYSEAVQDQCIAVVGRNLGEAFEHTETRVYECNEISHRIATFRHRASGALLNLIPGGSYLMGSDEDEDEQPIHTVTIAPMLIGKYAVSQSVWDKIGGEDQRNWKGPELPIEGVSWKDVNAWLEKSGDGLRLPSESEWEYACRAGTATSVCFGERATIEQINFDPNEPLAHAINDLHKERTVPIGSLPSNAFGLHEVHGNVWEWCQDCWTDNYSKGPNTAQAHDLEDPIGRIIRGGSWARLESFCRSASRSFYSAEVRDDDLGFRLCRNIG